MRWESKAEPRYDRGEVSFGGGWDSPSYGGGGRNGAVRTYRETGPKPAPQRPTLSGGKGAAAGPMLQLQPGDRVEHTAFGQGDVLEVQPMPGDAMVTVRFAGQEKPKRLMLKFAGSHMKKL